jgi:hypothetical protein
MKYLKLFPQLIAVFSLLPRPHFRPVPYLKMFFGKRTTSEEKNLHHRNSLLTFSSTGEPVSQGKDFAWEDEELLLNLTHVCALAHIAKNPFLPLIMSSHADLARQWKGESRHRKVRRLFFISPFARRMKNRAPKFNFVTGCGLKLTTTRRSFLPPFVLAQLIRFLST